MTERLLFVDELRLCIGETDVVDGLSLELSAGEVLALVGASGSGKTLTALSIIGLLPPAVRAVSGSIFYKGSDLLTLTEPELRLVRGGEIAMIFQEPMTSLNPVMTVGAQIVEAIRLHMHCSKAEARQLATQALREVQVPEPEMRLKSYPHQLSGGLRQRAMIAMALACSPSLLVADEPTTALDVTIQAGVMELLRKIREERDLAILLITHDIALAAEVSDRIAVIEAGKIIEERPARDIVASPSDATRALIAAVKKRETWRK